MSPFLYDMNCVKKQEKSPKNQNKILVLWGGELRYIVFIERGVVFSHSENKSDELTNYGDHSYLVTFAFGAQALVEFFASRIETSGTFGAVVE